MREEFGDDYLIINGAIFLSEIKTYLLRSCLCVKLNVMSASYLSDTENVAKYQAYIKDVVNPLWQDSCHHLKFNQLGALRVDSVSL